MQKKKKLVVNMAKIFVSFSAENVNENFKPIISNMEVPYGDFTGIDDIRDCEDYIGTKLKLEGFDLIKIVILNWKRFNT